MAIQAALNMSCVSRLKTAWNGLSQSHQKRFHDLTVVTDASLNYCHYRKVLANAKKPLIPFQALCLRELTFIEENNSRLENGWINVEKMAMLAKVITTMADYQKSVYKLSEVDVIRHYLERPPLLLNDREIMQASRTCEPSMESPVMGHKRGRGSAAERPSILSLSSSTPSSSSSFTRKVSLRKTVSLSLSAFKNSFSQSK